MTKINDNVVDMVFKLKFLKTMTHLMTKRDMERFLFFCLSVIEGTTTEQDIGNINELYEMFEKRKT